MKKLVLKLGRYWNLYITSTTLVVLVLSLWLFLLWLFCNCFCGCFHLLQSIRVFYLLCLLAFVPLLNNSSPIQSTVFYVFRIHPSSSLPPPLSIPSAIHRSIHLRFSRPRHILLPPSVPLSVTPDFFILPSVHSFPSYPLSFFLILLFPTLHPYFRPFCFQNFPFRSAFVTSFRELY